MTPPSNTARDARTQAAILACEAHLDDPVTIEQVTKWLTEPVYAEFRERILTMIDRHRWHDIDDGFHMALPFGTGGRRGRRGIGPNRINSRTIAESAYALVQWVKDWNGGAAGTIVIARDTRVASLELARVCARVIAGAGGRVLVFDSYRPTPELSFAVRHLGAQAGIVVSASHNPPTDNGFKAYGPSGGQVVPPLDDEIIAKVRAIGDASIPMPGYLGELRAHRIGLLGHEVDDAYRAALDSVPLGSDRDVRIVYSSLHGVGDTSVVPALERAGFADLHIVKEQSFADGRFPNVPGRIPNPEVPAALRRAQELAARVDADIALATDPDGDRLGCAAVRTRAGVSEWRCLNGNQLAALLTHHVLSSLDTAGRLPSDALVLKTVVTTDMVARIANHFGASVVGDLLVGFKYIGCVLDNLDDPERFAFACEESHGYLSRPHARDKDAVNAALLLAEAAATLKRQGTGLWARLYELYRSFGYHTELLYNIERPGKTGSREIAKIVAGFRGAHLSEIGGLRVVATEDRGVNRRRWPDGREEPISPVSVPGVGVIEALLPATDNLLIYRLAGGDGVDGAALAVRPSGTEPKCKFYVMVRADVPSGAPDDEMDAVMAGADATANRIRDAALKLADGFLLGGPEPSE